MNLDEHDLQILARLERDAATRRKTLAAAVGISEPTLSKKIGTLVAERIIEKFTIEIDYGKLGLRTNAITLIKLVQQSDEALRLITDALLAMPNAIGVASLVGEWDLYVRWMWQGPDDLVPAVRSLLKIAPIKVETLVLGETLRNERGAQLATVRA